MTRRHLLLLTALTACNKPATEPESKDPPKQYKLSGKIVRIDQKRKSFLIEHGPITAADGKVWMEGMTMEFPVKDDAALAAAKPGQPITATVFQRESDYEYWISGVHLQ